MPELIVAMDKRGGIGLKGQLPWKNSAELNIFRIKTMDKTVVFGSTTYEKLPILNNRKVYVLTRKSKEGHKDSINSLEELDNTDDIIIAGGRQVYKTALEKPGYITRIHISIMDGVYECDTFFDKKWLENFVIVDTFSGYSEFQHYVLEPTTNGEQQYINILRDLLHKNTWKKGRNALTCSSFNNDMTFDLRNGFPLLTTKKMFLRGIVYEFLMFINGRTDTNELEERKINIWKGNTTREFLDNRGLKNYAEGVIGPCFIEGTKVLTESGYKNIESVENDDKLYTHTGQWKPILEKFSKSHSDSLIEIKACYHPKITVTPEHPFYVKSYIIKDRYQGKRVVPIYSEPKWVEAKDLTPRCVIGMKIETEEIIPKFGDITIDTEEQWFMFGFFLGDGWVQTEVKYPERICFAVNDKERDMVVSKISKVLNIQLLVTYEHCFKYRCHNKKYTDILKTFGKYALGKIIPNWVHKAPNHMIRWFLDGYCASDGYLARSISSKNDSKRYTTISPDIAYSVQRLYLKLGIFASISLTKRSCYKKVFEDKESYLNNAYCIEVYENKIRQGNYSHIENNYAWFNISSVDEILFSQPIQVYNFDVEEDHTYTVENLAVHNCYGYQWRFFNAPYRVNSEGLPVPPDGGIDQLANVIDLIKNDPRSRRIIMTTYNPSQAEEGVLYPCHSIIIQFYVDDEYLDMFCYNRSQDFVLGTPFNIASSSLLLMLVSKLTGKTPRYFHLTMGDTHIYEEHVHAVAEIIDRIPFKFPELKLPNIKSLDDLLTLSYKDFVLSDYNYHPAIKVPMIA